MINQSDIQDALAFLSLELDNRNYKVRFNQSNDDPVEREELFGQIKLLYSTESVDKQRQYLIKIEASGMIVGAHAA